MRPQRRKPAAKEPEPDIERNGELDDLLAQLDNAGVTARLSRFNETAAPKRWDYVGTIDPVTDTFIDDVKERYGGGNYRIRMFVNGKNYLKGSYHTFSIEGKPRTDDAPPVAPVVPVKSLEERIKEWAPVAVTFAGAVSTLVAALRPAAPPAGVDVATTVTMLRDAEERGERRGMTIGELKAGGGKSDGGMMEVAKAYAGPFFSMLEKRQQLALQSPPVNTPPMVQPAQQIPPSTTPTAVSVSLPAEYAFLAPMRPFYPQLAAQAQGNVHPRIIADFVLAKMSAEHLQAIDTAARRPDFRDVMRRELAPIVAEYPDWIDEFLEQIVDVVTQAEDDDEPDQTPTTTKARARKKKP